MVKTLGTTDFPAHAHDIQRRPGADAFGNGSEDVQLLALVQLIPLRFEARHDCLLQQLQRQCLELFGVEPLANQRFAQQG
ncbi:hypothetical protein D3C84_799250 [compost metagenome]